jgi:hypothetical protein
VLLADWLCSPLRRLLEAADLLLLLPLLLLRLQM